MEIELKKGRPFRGLSFYKILKENLIENGCAFIPISSMPESYQENPANLVDKFKRRDQLKVTFKRIGDDIILRNLIT